MWYISVLQKKDIFQYVTTCVNLKDIMLSEMSVTERQILYSFTPRRYLEYQIHRVEWWLLRDGGGSGGIFV